MSRSKRCIKECIQCMSKACKQSTLKRVTIFPRWLPATKLSKNNTYQRHIRGKLFSWTRKFSMTEKTKQKNIYLHFMIANMAASSAIHKLSLLKYPLLTLLSSPKRNRASSHLVSTRFATQSSRILRLESGKELLAQAQFLSIIFADFCVFSQEQKKCDVTLNSRTGILPDCSQNAFSRGR